MDNSQKEKLLKRKTEASLEVFRYFSDMDDSVKRVVYKRMVENACSMASLLPSQAFKKQMLQCLSIGLDIAEDPTPIFNFLGIVGPAKERILSLMDDRDSRVLTELDICYSATELPTWKDFLSLYDYYALPFRHNQSEENLKTQIYYFYESAGKCSGDELLTENYPASIENCFAFIPYQYVFMNAISGSVDLSSANNLKSFSRLYGNGQLIDSVLDTIVNCGIFQVSEYLWSKLVDNCERYPYFSEVVQDRYVSFRRFCPMLPEYEFNIGDIDIPDNLNSLGALPQIYLESSRREPISDIQMQNLINGLINQKDIIADDAALFKSIFKGPDYSVQRALQWRGTVEALASFLEVAWDGKVDKKKYSTCAAFVFTQKNGKPCSPSSLMQPKDSVDKYRDLFNHADIKRSY